MDRCVILLSGGLDSVTTLAYAKSLGYDVHALSFNYGQKHLREIELAKLNAEKYQADHTIIDLRSAFSQFTSSLINSSQSIEKDRDLEKEKDIPNTYVPARNIIMLSVASGFAESKKINKIFIGANAIDYSGYPDCRPEFIANFEQTINVGTAFAKGNFRILAPLINFSKAEIVKLGISLNVDYVNTTSCYSPIEDMACGHCDACQLRLKGFNEAGLKDPAKYYAFK